MKKCAFVPALILSLMLLVALSTAAEAVSAKTWTESRFFGMTKEAAWKFLGEPDAPGELDGWKLTDSPEFLLMGMLQYSDNKVVGVYGVCQPGVTYQKVRDLQLNSPDTDVVFDKPSGLLCKFKAPQPGGPIFISVSPTSDAGTGPVVCESLMNPFEGDSSGTSGSATQPKTAGKGAGKIDPEELKSVMMLDCFDWHPLDEKGKLAILKRIKAVWRARGDETDANAIEAKTLQGMLSIGDQANIFECACQAAGIDPEPYRTLNGQGH